MKFLELILRDIYGNKLGDLIIYWVWEWIDWDVIVFVVVVVLGKYRFCGGYFFEKSELMVSFEKW